MAEWLFEAGIGEARAALVADGRIVKARIEREDEMVRAGAVCAARLDRILLPGRRALLRLESGEEALIEPPPRGVTEGASLNVRIVRAAIPESGRQKLAKAISAEAEAFPQPGPDLLARVTATGLPVRHGAAHLPDALEAADWSEVMEEAMRGEIGGADAALRLSLTPAMTLIDIDGALPLGALARAGARMAGEAIVRHDIAGSIGIDFPTLSGKGERQAVAEALDAALEPLGPGSFERTAVNGFGFMQIVRRRQRASLPELLQGDPLRTAALALLRRAERQGGGMGPVTLVAPQRLLDSLDEAHLAELARRRGGTVALRCEPGLTIFAAYAA